jgi:hypothetical protein
MYDKPAAGVMNRRRKGTVIVTIQSSQMVDISVHIMMMVELNVHRICWSLDVLMSL